MATPHNSRLTAQAPLRQLRHGICVAKMLDNVGLRYPHRASGAKAPRTLRPLPLLRFAVSATGGAHLCSIQYYLRFWLGICRTSLAVSALRIMRYCPIFFPFVPVKVRFITLALWYNEGIRVYLKKITTVLQAQATKLHLRKNVYFRLFRYTQGKNVSSRLDIPLRRGYPEYRNRI